VVGRMRGLSRPEAALHVRLLFAPALLLLAACTGPFLDQPSKVRQARFVAPPIYSRYSSDDGSSYEWNALFWLVGADVESGRHQSRALPIWWHNDEGPYVQTTLLFPLWYSRTTEDSDIRFYSLLYGSSITPEGRTDYVLPPIFWNQFSEDGSHHETFLLFVFKHERWDEQRTLTLVSLLGLASLLTVETGYPPEGETVPALGRESSRRIWGPEALGLVSLFAYDDIGDRRDMRLLTLFSSEKLSLFRSWRGRGDDPFVREWLFPLYMNVQDEGSGWDYVGPLWGGWHDEEGTTSWWLLGLVSRREEAAGNTWRVLGIPVSSP
jgi:hypothetical protein